MNIDETILNLILNGYDQDFIESLYANSNIGDINIFDDLGYDSIKFIQLIIDLEETFKIEIPEDLLIIENFSSINQINDLIFNLFNMEGKQNVYE